MDGDGQISLANFVAGVLDTRAKSTLITRNGRSPKKEFQAARSTTDARLSRPVGPRQKGGSPPGRPGATFSQREKNLVTKNRDQRLDRTLFLVRTNFPPPRGYFMEIIVFSLLRLLGIEWAGWFAP